MAKSKSKIILMLVVVIGLANVFLPYFLSGLAFGERGLLGENVVEYRAEGYRMQKIGLLEDALINYQKAVQADPLYACAYNDLGIVYEMMGKSDEAEAAYLKAIQLDSNYGQAFTNLALLYERKHDYMSAAKYWIRRAYLGNPDDVWVKKAQQKILEIGRIIPEVQKLYSPRDTSDPLENKYNNGQLGAKEQALLKSYFDK